VSNPVPSHLEPEVAELERGNLDDDYDRRMTLYSDLIVANAVPAKYQPEVAGAISSGALSPAGDRLRYADDDGLW
jgi:hypothetical protein